MVCLFTRIAPPQQEPLCLPPLTNNEKSQKCLQGQTPELSLNGPTEKVCNIWIGYTTSVLFLCYRIDWKVSV